MAQAAKEMEAVDSVVVVEVHLASETAKAAAAAASTEEIKGRCEVATIAVMIVTGHTKLQNFIDI